MKITTWVDWGKAFVDDNGSFYAGTTLKQKQNAKKASEGSNMYILLSDVHTKESSEFAVNGGLYPVHNLLLKDQPHANKLGVPEGKTTSPQLTDMLLELVKDKRAGLIVPRHVFFQDYNGEPAEKVKPAFSFKDVEETFGIRKLDAEECLDGGIEYVVNAKHFFNGAGLQSTEWLGHVEGVPDMEMNIFTLLKQRYGLGKGLEFNINGVVMGICIYQTASGIRQIFPKSEVNIILDASTHLLVKELGFSKKKKADDAITAMCKQVGINYLTTKDYIKRKC
ncbi:hypothetical protein FJZ53_01335 [Candidatus Woesearchaeota archaeon]|nr:hypothetical protein [Candidatus Woesearchaeota archaeon]